MIGVPLGTGQPRISVSATGSTTWMGATGLSRIDSLQKASRKGSAFACSGSSMAAAGASSASASARARSNRAGYCMK